MLWERLIPFLLQQCKTKYVTCYVTCTVDELPVYVVMSEVRKCLLPQCGWTVVHFAADNGHLEMLRELLDRFNCEADKRDKKVGICIALHTNTCTHILKHTNLITY